MRFQDDARLTKDIDLGLRDDISDADELHERLIEALMADPDGDPRPAPRTQEYQ